MNTENDQAKHFANVWGKLTAPVKPSEDGLRIYREEAERFSDKRILILGATPELVDMAVESGAEKIVSIERFPGVVAAMRQLGKKDWSSVDMVIGNWLEDRPDFHSAFNCILCDGGLLFLEYPAQWGQLFRIVRTYLEPDGVFVAKEWAEPPGIWDYDRMLQDHVAAFKEEASRLNLEQKHRAYIKLLSELRIIVFVNATQDDGSFDQDLLIERSDRLIEKFEKEFPDNSMIGITHAAFKYLARSQPGTTDTVAGVRYDRTSELLAQNGFESRYFPLPDPPIPDSNYMFAAKLSE